MLYPVLFHIWLVNVSVCVCLWCCCAAFNGRRERQRERERRKINQLTLSTPLNKTSGRCRGLRIEGTTNKALVSAYKHVVWKSTCMGMKITIISKIENEARARSKEMYRGTGMHTHTHMFFTWRDPVCGCERVCSCMVNERKLKLHSKFLKEEWKLRVECEFNEMLTRLIHIFNWVASYCFCSFCCFCHYVAVRPPPLLHHFFLLLQKRKAKLLYLHSICSVPSSAHTHKLMMGTSI